MSTTVTYKGNVIATVDNNTKTLNTRGKYLEDNVTLTDVSGVAGVISVVDTIDTHGGIIRTITSAEEIHLASKTITENGTYNPQTDGVDGYSSVSVNVSASAEGVAYVYSDLDGNGVVDIEGYKYVSCDFAPVKDDKFRFWIDVDENDLTFKAPVSVPTYSSYRYTGRIDWGDGSPQADFAYDNTDHTHTYSEAGRYCVEIWRTGGAERFSVDTPRNADKPKVVAMEFYFISYPSNNIYGLANLRKVRYSSAQTAVSFSNCPSLADIILPDSLTTINANGFANCTALEEITIPSAVTNIGSSAFRYSGLKEIHMLPTTPPTLGASAFDNLPTGYTIYVPIASLSSYQAADVWSNYASHITGE